MKSSSRLWRKLVRLMDGKATVEGFVDGLTAGEVSGWALDAAQSGRRVHIVARAGDRILAEALADRPRADLMAAGKGDGRCGFRLRLPEDVDWGNEVRVEAVNGRRRVLLSRGRLDRWARTAPGHSAPQLAQAQAGGCLEMCRDGVVVGWAFDGSKSGSVKVDFFDNERFLGSAAATIRRPDLRLASIPRGAAGFRFDLPAIVDGGVAERLRARLASTRRDLQRAPGYPFGAVSPPAIETTREGAVIVVPSLPHPTQPAKNGVMVLTAGEGIDWRKHASQSAAVALASSADPDLLATLSQALATLDPGMADVWIFGRGQGDADRVRAEILIGRLPGGLVLTGGALDSLAAAFDDAAGDPVRLIGEAAMRPLIWRALDLPAPAQPPARPAGEWLSLHQTASRVTLADAISGSDLVSWDTAKNLFDGHSDIDFEILTPASSVVPGTIAPVAGKNVAHKLVDFAEGAEDDVVRARIAAANGQAVVVRYRSLAPTTLASLPRLGGLVALDGVASVEIHDGTGVTKALVVNRAVAAKAGCDRNAGEPSETWRHVLEANGRIHLRIDESALSGAA